MPQTSFILSTISYKTHQSGTKTITRKTKLTDENDAK
jgi:hypothetical protein